MARKRKSKPAGKRRNHRQVVKENHSKWREEAQLIGLISTVPEGAIHEEVVDPSSQGEQMIPSLDLAAARNGWATPEHKKLVIVDKLVEAVESEEEKPFIKVMAAQALAKMDQIQYERDNPEAAGKAKGGQVNVGVGVNVAVVNPLEMFKEALKEVEVDEIEEQIKAAGKQVNKASVNPENNDA